jgi:hypothetical protein
MMGNVSIGKPDSAIVVDTIIGCLVRFASSYGVRAHDYCERRVSSFSKFDAIKNSIKAPETDPVNRKLPTQIAMECFLQMAVRCR